MIRSMTGFGDASMSAGKGGGVHYFVEVRSLNSKYFKAIIRLPEEFQALEAEIESELRRRLGRGSVFLSAQCSDSTGETGYTINDKALAAYLEQLRRLPQVKAGEVTAEIGPLLSLPGVLLPPANEEERLQRARSALMTLVGQACDRLIAMREREGAALKADLLARRDAIAEKLRLISGRSPGVVLEYERRLKGRIETMLRDAGLKVEPADVVREIAVYAERTDITEEITRLTGHIEQFTQLIAGADGGADKPVGRTLDFLSQEMLREANTIASKCADSEISRHIVEVKGEIDRIKEQVQNIE